MTLGDIVNVLVSDPTTKQTLPHRAKLLDIGEDGFKVQLDDCEEPRIVNLEDIQQRVRLPWHPRDLRDYLIVFRRRNASKEDYVEDLQVRRDLIKRLLKLFTTEAEWRPNRGTEPMHMYYTGFDWMKDAEIDEMFDGEDGVPDDLNFQDIDEHPDAASVSSHFSEW